MNGVWETHGDYIVNARKAGDALLKIGNAVGVTDERIRQLLVKHYGTTKLASHLSSLELSRIVNLNVRTINDYRNKGIIKAVNNGHYRYLYDIDAVKAIIAHRRCKICGDPLPKGKWAYCSEPCRKAGHYDSQKRTLWRIFRRKRGEPITASIAYERKGNNESQ